MTDLKTWRWPMIWAGLAVAYFLTAQLGRMVAVPHEPVSSVWPAAGIAVAALLCFGPRAWPGVFLGDLASNLAGGLPLTAAALSGCGPVLEVLMIAWLARRFGVSSDPFAHARETARFLVLSVLPGTLVSAVIGATVLLITDVEGGSRWSANLATWWFGDSIGILLVTPFLIAWSHPLSRWPASRVLESGLSFAVLVAVCVFAFVRPSPPGGAIYPQGGLVIPLLVWSVFRFGRRGATLAMLMTAVMAIFGALHGYGPFTRESMHDSLILTQANLGLIALSIVMMSALLSERQLATQELESAHHNLERLVAERTAELLRTNVDLQREIEERRRVEVALREANQQYADLADSIPGLLYQTRGRVDGSGFSVPFVSSQSQEYLGWTAEEIHDQPLRLLEAIHPDDWPVYYANAVESMRTGNPFEAEFRVVSRTGTVRWLKACSRGRLVTEDEILYNGVAIDVTDRKLAEAALQASHTELEQRVAERTRALQHEIAERKRAEEQSLRMQAELAHASRLSVMGEMAAGVAHELHQPLTVIANFANGCIRRAQGGKVKVADLVGPLKDIADEAMRAAEIIRRVRSFIRNREIERRPLNVNALLHDALQLARFECRQRGVTVEVETADDLRPVIGDPIHLTQVVLNLVMNALDAMNDVEPERRRLRLKTAVQGQDTLVLTVSDSGPGIPPEIRERLFDQFFTTKPEGLGMGLPISRSIVEAHGGWLRVESGLGQGATFQVTLPLQQEAATAPANLLARSSFELSVED